MRSSVSSTLIIAVTVTSALLSSPSRGDSPGAVTQANLAHFSLSVRPGGWKAVTPWRAAIEDALARANALLRSRVPAGRLSPAAHRRLAALRRASTRRSRPSRISFSATVGAREAVQASCRGTIRMSFPAVFDMTVDALSRELIRVATLLRMRPTSCRNGTLVAPMKEQGFVDEVVDATSELGVRVFRGSKLTVADRLGLPQPSPLQSKTLRMQGRLNRLLARAGTPRIFVDIESGKGGGSYMRVNAKPWSRCRIGKSPPRTTPFRVKIDRRAVDLKCDNNGAVSRIHIPRRAASRPGSSSISVTYGPHVGCSTDGIHVSGGGITVSDGAHNNQRVPCRGTRARATRIKRLAR